jgi:hypothetical protein
MKEVLVEAIFFEKGRTAGSPATVLPFYLSAPKISNSLSQGPALLAEAFFLHFEIVGQRNRNRANNTNGRAIGGLKKIRGLP